MQTKYGKGVLVAMGLGLILALKHVQKKNVHPQGVVLVTGAGSGIGYAVAQTLKQAGFDVWGSVRQTTQAEALKRQGIRPLMMDISDPKSIRQAVEHLKKNLDGQKLVGLVNNAGIAVTGPVAMLSPKDLRTQFEINVFGLFELTQALLPQMASRSKIVQMSSITGETTQPLIGAYSSSKHALEALSTALRRELQLIGSSVEVVIVQPGSVETPIWQKLENTVNLEQYLDTPYAHLSQTLWGRIQSARNRATPERVSQAVLKIFQRSQNAPLYIVSNDWIEEVIVPRVLSDKLLDRVFLQILGSAKGS